MSSRYAVAYSSSRSNRQVVDVILERGRGFAQAEWCDQRFVQAKPGDESCQPFMAFSYAYPVERSNDIVFCEDPGAGDGVQGLPNQWQGVTVLDRDVVEAAVVDADSHSAAWFLRQEHRRCYIGAGGPNPSFG